MGIKRDKYDKVFSDLVRERSNWTCECCGKHFPEGRRQGLHCSHVYSRRHQATRYLGLNAFAHCYSCHQQLGGSPIEFTAWVRNQLGDGAFDRLREAHNTVVKRTKAEKEELYAHLKEELKKIQEKRKNGETGYIDFVEFD